MTRCEFYPHMVKLPVGKGGEYHERAVEYVKSNFQVGTYTWIGLSFFFTKEKDAVLFALKWS